MVMGWLRRAAILSLLRLRVGRSLYARRWWSRFHRRALVLTDTANAPSSTNGGVANTPADASDGDVPTNAGPASASRGGATNADAARVGDADANAACAARIDTAATTPRCPYCTSSRVTA